MADLFSGVLPFVAVAKAGSFRGGASQLGVSTAAVSKAVRRLEEEVGVQLLRRSSRSVALTPEGAAFLDRCARAVDLVTDGRDALDLARSDPSGTLTVSLPHILGRSLVRRLPRFRDAFPSLRLSLRLSDRYVDLVGEQVDVALRVGELADSSLMARRVWRTRWALVASPEYVRRHGRPEHPSDLAEHVLMKFRAPSNRFVEFRLPDDEGTPRPVDTRTDVDVDQGELLLESSIAGLGICQAMDFMVAEHVRAGRLVELLPKWSAPGPPVHALWHPGQQTSPRIRVFLDFLAAWGSETVE